MKTLGGSDAPKKAEKAAPEAAVKTPEPIEQKAAPVHPGRRLRHGPHDLKRHPRVLRAGRADRKNRHRHRQPASAQDDGDRFLWDADLRGA